MSLVNAVIIWLLVIVILLFFCFKEVVLRMFLRVLKKRVTVPKIHFVFLFEASSERMVLYARREYYRINHQETLASCFLGGDS
jgi:hypothetical protein